MTQAGTIYYRNIETGLREFPDEPQVTLPFQASRVIISNDTAAALAFSFQRPRLDGELFEGDDPLVLDGVGVGRIWLKTAATSKVRIWAWRI